MRPLALLLLASALLAAGCVDPASDDVEAASVEPSASTRPDPVAWPVDLEGKMTIGAFACSVTCVGETIVGGERIFETDAFGTVEMELSMEWSAASPATDRMLFGIFTCDPAACTSDEDLSQIQYVEGSSPLVLDLREVEIPEGERMFLFANENPAVQGALAYVATYTGQAFTIKGEIETA